MKGLNETQTRDSTLFLAKGRYYEPSFFLSFFSFLFPCLPCHSLIPPLHPFTFASFPFNRSSFLLILFSSLRYQNLIRICRIDKVTAAGKISHCYYRYHRYLHSVAT